MKIEEKTVPIMWTNNTIIIGTYKDTHIRLISENKLDLDKENWNLGRAYNDTLYYYSFSELNNSFLNKIFKNLIQQDF